MCSPNDPKWSDMRESKCKTCTKCLSTKPLSDFYMVRAWRSLTPGEPKPMSRCKECHNAASRARYASAGKSR